MKTNELMRLLAAKYQREAVRGSAKWVLIEEAPDGSDFGGRRCDLIAMGVWRSTNDQIIGHEVKVSRSDWVRELQQPENSDAFIPYCHRWYIVAASGIVKPGELRGSWGLIEAAKNGRSIRIRKQADLNSNVKPLTRRMTSTWMRRVSQGASEDLIRSRVKAALEERKAVESINVSRNHDRYEQLLERVDKFEKASGISLSREWQLGKIAEAIRVMGTMDPEKLRGQLESHRNRYRDCCDTIDGVIESLYPSEQSASDDG